MEGNTVDVVVWRDDNFNVGDYFLCMYLWEKIKNFDKMRCVSDSDLTFMGASLYTIRAGSGLWNTLHENKAVNPKVTSFDMPIFECDLKPLLQKLFDLSEADVESMLSSIKQKTKKVLPLTPQQAMEGKVLDEDVEAVNKQIKDTFDGHSAVVRHVNFLVRETFEQYGWSIRKHEFEKHAYVFSAKEKK